VDRHSTSNHLSIENSGSSNEINLADHRSPQLQASGPNMPRVNGALSSYTQGRSDSHFNPEHGKI
jgi:hypothetical protein